jgi:predicted metalloendopeptidase
MNTLIHSVIGVLSTDLSAPINMMLHISGGKELPKCRELCIQNTDAALGQLVGQFFVLVNFSLAAKDSVNELVISLRRSLEQNITKLDFFDK